jgi:hypothetical protein
MRDVTKSLTDLIKDNKDEASYVKFLAEGLRAMKLKQVFVDEVQEKLKTISPRISDRIHKRMMASLLRRVAMDTIVDKQEMLLINQCLKLFKMNMIEIEEVAQTVMESDFKFRKNDNFFHIEIIKYGLDPSTLKDKRYSKVECHTCGEMTLAKLDFCVHCEMSI